MNKTNSITFVAAVNSRKTFESNLLASPCFGMPHRHQILAQEKFTAATKAYNAAIDLAENDLIVFAHQDIIFPERWISQLENALDFLACKDPNWGVLGCWGTTRTGRNLGHIYSNGLGILGEPFENPVPVATLDEIVLVIRKSSGLRFNERLEHFHFYGADICMAAGTERRTNYVIPAFCIHNTQFNLVLPKEFYQCYQQFRSDWIDQLPVYTPCIKVTKSRIPMYQRQAHDFFFRHIRRKIAGTARVEDVGQLLETV